MLKQQALGRHRTTSAAPVFVDRSGRRLRLARAGGALAAAGCTTVVAVMVGSSIAGPSISLPHLPTLHREAARVAAGTVQATGATPAATDASATGVVADAGQSVATGTVYAAANPSVVSAPAALVVAVGSKFGTAPSKSLQSVHAAVRSTTRSTSTHTVAHVPVKSTATPTVRPTTSHTPAVPAVHGKSSTAPGRTKLPHR